MLKIVYYRHNKHMHTVSLPTQKINFYSLTFIIDGNHEFDVNGEKYVLSNSEALFLQPQTLRGRPEIRNVDYVNFNFISEEKFDLPLIIPDAVSNTIQSLLIGFDDIYNETFNSDDERLTLLLECILKQLKYQMIRKAESPLVLKIKQYVKERIHQKIPLAWICRITFFSVSYCESVFKKETGMSITDYILEQRIAEAKRLLWRNQYPLKQIAEMVGFNDYNYFARTFKKRTGYTPTEFIKKSVLTSL